MTFGIGLLLSIVWIVSVLLAYEIGKRRGAKIVFDAGMKAMQEDLPEGFDLEEVSPKEVLPKGLGGVS